MYPAGEGHKGLTGASLPWAQRVADGRGINHPSYTVCVLKNMNRETDLRHRLTTLDAVVTQCV